MVSHVVLSVKGNTQTQSSRPYLLAVAESSAIFVRGGNLGSKLWHVCYINPILIPYLMRVLVGLC